jgi:hypothetical protein
VPCSLRFGGAYCFHLQGRLVSQATARANSLFVTRFICRPVKAHTINSADLEK